MPIARADLAYDLPILAPIGIAVSTLSTVWQQVLPSDPVRRAVVFHNPGSVTLFVAPANLAAQALAGAIAVLPQTEFSIFSDDDARCNAAWMAWVASGVSQPATILNFTDTPVSAAPPPMPQMRQALDIAITSPVTTGFALDTTSRAVIGSNPVRRGIQFHNPGEVTAFVAPSNLAAAAGAGSLTILPKDTKTIMARGRVRVGAGWNGRSETGSGNPLTILEYL